MAKFPCCGNDNGDGFKIPLFPIIPFVFPLGLVVGAVIGHLVVQKKILTKLDRILEELHQKRST